MSRLVASLDAPFVIAQRAVVDLLLSVEDGGSAFDLMGSTIILEVQDSDAALVFQKSSVSDSQIEILTQSGATLGQALLHFVGGDTEDLEIGGQYWVDAWVYRADGRVEQVLTRRRFQVGKTVHEPDTTPPDVSAGTPLLQTVLWRRFLHTWSADGDSDTVTVPGSGMLDAVYHVSLMIEDVPAGGAASILTVPSATKTAAQFVIEAAGELTAGTTISVELSDR